MLQTLFPKAHHRYTSLSLLGPILDSFATWLVERGYRHSTLRVMLSPMPRIDQWLRGHVQDVADLDVEVLEACWATFRQHSSSTSGVIRALAQYLDYTGVLPPSRLDPLTPSEQLLSRYQEHLTNVRGFSEASIRNHVRTVSQFLGEVRYEAQPSRHLTAIDIESFVCHSGQRLARTSLQQVVAHLRGFLRFLVVTGQGTPGLADTIDTPRVYRHEQLPRSLPWPTVMAFLESIDRETSVGLRDYTMLLLIAAYGLRISEVAALTLDDIHWREDWLQVRQPKIRSGMRLPLTQAVASALVHYLRAARPKGAACRHLFLRCRAPVGPLKPNAVTMAFDRRARQSTSEIPFSGAHCLRHAYAVHLLRSGTCVKTIGDLLGHRDAQSTDVYLRLAIEDLREVPLPLPGATAMDRDQELAS
ncbi:MAG: tyrosine-type recombinase/integrase [Chloroflexi bacterium]|nr:tyrosine-type recombinase/integrase [Chloroflexota bacterium]